MSRARSLSSPDGFLLRRGLRAIGANPPAGRPGLAGIADLKRHCGVGMVSAFVTACDSMTHVGAKYAGRGVNGAP